MVHVVLFSVNLQYKRSAAVMHTHEIQFNPYGKVARICTSTSVFQSQGGNKVLFQNELKSLIMALV